jgi:hypothetical protein
MTKSEALALIDDHKSTLLDPVEMLQWTYLRVIIHNIPDNQWREALITSLGILSQ